MQCRLGVQVTAGGNHHPFLSPLLPVRMAACGAAYACSPADCHPPGQRHARIARAKHAVSLQGGGAVGSAYNPIDHIFQFHKALKRELKELESAAAGFQQAVDNQDRATIPQVQRCARQCASLLPVVWLFLLDSVGGSLTIDWEARLPPWTARTGSFSRRCRDILAGC